MDGFLAVVLVCAATVPVQDCTEATAADVRKVRVANEIGCAVGWQEIVARSDLREGLGRAAYLKTLCRRVRAEP
ncbi:hypothetical protein OPKNFCMD_1269 [Methylobacterium crusticola]|uniref:Uncharacterized protein n=1 Tax=Methylobacterium crusticola TaxID=1697972 RepID=A0ABQ4QVD8_9HYPH|nr:hypothetical protein [Methylobacterium crusticola]GJD48547.1 hypothetical protein OPKNFCMD_1269 [Methylobacterium crusticola]